MEKDAEAVERLVELPPETREFLAQLRQEDINTLKDGLRLVNATMIVGKFVKWCIIGLLGILAGVVMFGESVMKIAEWFRH